MSPSTPVSKGSIRPTFEVPKTVGMQAYTNYCVEGGHLPTSGCQQQAQHQVCQQ